MSVEQRHLNLCSHVVQKCKKPVAHLSSQWLEADPCGNIYTIEIGTCYRAGLFPQRGLVVKNFQAHLGSSPAPSQVGIPGAGCPAPTLCVK